MQGRSRRAAWAVGALVVLGAIAGRSVLEGTASLRSSDELSRRGDVVGAIANAQRAARWYVPGAPHVAAAYDRLRAIALRAELAGDAETASLAWQAVRAGARGSRSLYQPFDDRLREADDHLARLLSEREVPGIDRGKSKLAIGDEHRALLSRDDLPRPLAVVGYYLGLVAFAFGAFRLGSALDEWAHDRGQADRWGEGRGTRALLGLAVAAVSVLTMIVALSRA